MTPMEILNTLGRVRIPFVPAHDGSVGIYVCGPTVQANPHVGHGRSAVAFDVIRRYLMYRGYAVTYVRNITDIDDKIIAAANEQGVSIEDVAARAAERFEATQDALGVLRPDVEPRATDHIAEIVDMIVDLIVKDHAYVAGGDVYFAVRSFADYARLSNRNLDEMLAGARIATGDIKRDPLDFALWKAAKPGEPQWPSPWGSGRPGWHIECSAMARRYLGDTLDIHGGGTDLIFPHHENEIAQSEAVTGRPFVNVWLHNGMVTLSGEKMSKSTGHFVDLASLLADHPPLAIRLFYLRAHYRSNVEFSPDLVADAASSFERLQSFRRRHAELEGAAPDRDIVEAFERAMDDDFNTPVALGVLFDAVREGNRLSDEGGDAAGVAAAVELILEVLGLIPEAAGLAGLATCLEHLAAELGLAPGEGAEETLERVINHRTEARSNQDWSTSDKIRDGLASIGIVIEDGANGVAWHRK
jgi:cysteinyl-tRNA synthetase